MFSESYNREELENLLLDLDRIGILPKREEISYLLEKTMDEGNPYRKVLKKIRKDPEKFLEEIVGHKIPVELYTRHEKEFYSIYGTEPLPTLEINPKYKRLVTQRVSCCVFALFPLLYIPYKNIGVSGRCLSFDYNFTDGNKKVKPPLKYKRKIRIPIVFSNRDEGWKKFVAIHENIHAIRHGWHRSLNFLKEELYASSSYLLEGPEKIEKIKTLVISSIHGGMYGAVFGLNTPYLISLVSAAHFLGNHIYPFGLFSPLVLSTVLFGSYGLHYFKKIRKFVRKCLREDINPFYLMLRSNIEEFNLNRSIGRQIEEKAKSSYRFKVIDLRLKKDPPGVGFSAIDDFLFYALLYAQSS